MNDIMAQPILFPHEVVPDFTTDGEPCYVSRCLDLPECMSHGETPEEALQNLVEARALFVKTLRELGRDEPEQQVPTAFQWNVFQQGASVGTVPANTWAGMTQFTIHGDFSGLSTDVSLPTVPA